ncbi:MAG: polysaccharide export protein [Pseudomonadota bacterium]|nr:polysaccharide export protein [Pseudomonadota bacterium]
MGSIRRLAIATLVFVISVHLQPVFAADEDGETRVIATTSESVGDDDVTTLPGRSPVPAPPTSSLPSSIPSSVPSAQAPAVSDYILGIGDKVRITTFGEASLSGDFQVSSTGVISMPLVGEVNAAGQTIAQLQAAVVTKLSNGFMKKPDVSIEVLNYRPFFIVGEIMKPGSYNFVNGMTVINAVAMAGGYTYRADKDDIKLKHGGPDGQEEQVTEGTAVHPGDVVKVPERFF